MTDARPSTYIIGMIVMTLFVGVMVAWLGVFDDYKTGFTTNSDYNEFNSTMNKRAELNASVTGLREAFEQDDEGLINFGPLDNIINGAWNTIKFFFSSFGFMEDVIRDAGNLIGIPGWITGLIILIVIVFIIFSVWGAIFQRDL